MHVGMETMMWGGLQVKRRGEVSQKEVGRESCPFAQGGKQLNRPDHLSLVLKQVATSVPTGALHLIRFLVLEKEATEHIRDGIR